MKNYLIILFFLINLSLYSQSNQLLELDLKQSLEIALENNLQLKRSEINDFE